MYLTDKKENTNSMQQWYLRKGSYYYDMLYNVKIQI